MGNYEEVFAELDKAAEVNLLSGGFIRYKWEKARLINKGCSA